jgi:Tol biopolymer transport system component
MAPRSCPVTLGRQSTTGLGGQTRQGHAIDVETAHYGDPHVSPDGRRVAVAVVAGASVRDIYVIDTVVGTSSRLTFGGVENRTPIWMHDGRRLVYIAYDRATNLSAIMIKSADGSVEAQKVTEVSGQAYAEDLTRDDATLIFSANSSTARGKFEAFRLTLQPGSTPTQELSAPGDAQNASLRLTASGWRTTPPNPGHPEVYVQSFASKGSRAQVSQPAV